MPSSLGSTLVTLSVQKQYEGNKRTNALRLQQLLRIGRHRLLILTHISEQAHLHRQTFPLHVHLKCLHEHLLLALTIFKFQIPFFWKTKILQMRGNRGIESIRHVA